MEQIFKIKPFDIEWPLDLVVSEEIQLEVPKLPFLGKRSSQAVESHFKNKSASSASSLRRLDV